MAKMSEGLKALAALQSEAAEKAARKAARAGLGRGVRVMRTILICKPGSPEDRRSGEPARLAPSRIERLLSSRWTWPSALCG